MLKAAVTAKDATPAAAPIHSHAAPGPPRCQKAHAAMATQPIVDPMTGTIRRLRGAVRLICCMERIAAGGGTRRSAGMTKTENPNRTPPVIADRAAVGWVTSRLKESIGLPLSFA